MVKLCSITSLVSRCQGRESACKLILPMEAPVEIRYAGVIIGRAHELRNVEGDDAFFLPGKEPMPVGTVLHLRSRQEETPARVVRAVESPDASICGMQVRLIGEAEEVAPDWIPAPPPVKPKASAPAPALIPVLPGTPTPTVEVNLAIMQAEVAKRSTATERDVAAVPEAVPVAVGSSLTGALEKAAASATPEAPGTSASQDEALAKAVENTSAIEAMVPAAPASPASDDLDIVITSTPPPLAVDVLLAVAEPLAPAAEAAPTAPVVEPGAAAKEAQGAATTSAPAGEDAEESPAQESAPSGEDMPPARPISGPSSRRKTKRRRYQQRV
jgi:hypothetical protein